MTKTKFTNAENRLEDVYPHEVSFVSKPAIRRTFLLTKSEEVQNTGVTEEVNTESSNKELGDKAEAHTETHMSEQLLKLLKEAKLSDEAAEAVAKAFETLTEHKEVVIVKEAFEAVGLELPTVEVEVEKEVIKEVIVEKEVIKEVVVEKAEEPADEYEVVLKSMEDGPAKDKFAAFVQKERDEKATALEAVAKAEEAKLAAETEVVEQEYIAKAEKEFSHIAVDPTKFGLALKAAKDALTDEHYATLEAVLQTGEKAVILSKQFEEVGGGINTLATAGTKEKIEVMAKKLIVDNPEMTIEKARVQIVDQNPEFYTEYYGG